MDREMRAPIGPSRQIDPFPRTRRRWHVTDAIMEHVEPQTAVARPIIEMVGVNQEHAKHRETVDHRVECRADFMVVDGIRHRRVDTDLTQLLEIGGPRRVIQVVGERPESAVFGPTRALRFESEFIDASRSNPPLRLVRPSPRLFVVHRLDPGPARP